MAAATWLRRRARDEAYSVEQPLEQGVAGFDDEIGDSVTRHEFRFARKVAQQYSNSELLDRIKEENYAEAVLFATTRRTAVSAFAAIVDEVESKPPETTVSAEHIEKSRQNARQRVQDALNHRSKPLMAHVLSPVFDVLREAHNELQGGSSGNPPRAYAGYRYAGHFAETAADAADELAYLLENAAN
ncbi:hypothetical protein [Haloprofundus marisrubri]|nr:hypothetical protein [Haloprofundus marisrubri]